MASRASARAAAARDQATSPPRQSTQSPVARRTRTRSASVEPGDNNAGPTTKQGRKNARQGSVESVHSNASAASSNQGGRRKATRGAEVLYPDLSAVVENDDEDEEEVEVKEGSGHPPQSPSGLSQMSGTTAQTSHTTAELAGLDPTMVVELLPDLWMSSLRLLDPLAPPNAPVDLVESTVKELKVPGSVGAKRFAHREEKFGLDRAKFGNDDYIRASFILQKVFGSQEAEAGISQPDAILQAANLATLIKELLVKEKEGLSTWNFMSNLDTWFPESFVSQFSDNIYVGNSTMLDESFEMALEIRTQYTVVALLYHNAGEAKWYPDEVLVGLFFDQPDEPSSDLSKYDDYTTNGYVKSLMRAGPANTQEQEAKIRERVQTLRDAFRQSDDALQAGDLVDFDQLEELFPWSKFLAKTVQWTSARLDEIKESVRQQGGVDNLVKSLIETITNNNSHAELNFEPHPSTATPRQLLPSANIVPGTTGRSLLAKSTVYKLESMKHNSSAPPNQIQRKATSSASAAASSSNRNAQVHRPGPTRTRPTGPSEPSEPPQASNDFNPMQEDDDEDNVEQRGSRKASDYLAVWNAHDREKNKENRPLFGRDKEKPAKRFIDAQANAQRVQWDSQDSGQSREEVADSSSRKHVREESDDESQDQGYEADRRNINPRRRIAAQAAQAVQQQSSVPVMRSSPKRARVQEAAHAAQEDRRIRRQQRQEAELQASARQAEDEENLFLEEDEDIEEDPPRPTASQIRVASRREAAIVRLQKARTQTRRAWSEEDTNHFIDLIEEVGCSWSTIHKEGSFEVERDQVALKDKARNLKVQYLRADIPLPLNFDKIALGKKEIKSVQAARPDWEP